MLDPLVQAAFSIYSSAGVYALLLGSGVSRPAGIPTGWEIVQELIRNVARLNGVEPTPSPLEWYRAQFAEEPLYGAILARVAPTAAERRNVLRRFFEPDPSRASGGGRLPTEAHQAIAALVVEGLVRVIVTTNFDRLLEMALTTAGARFQVVSSADAIKGMQPLAHDGCTVVKVNGDYLDARIRNTAGELERYDPATSRLLERICDEFGLVVCGWSADWDVALRAILQRKASRRYSVYWTTRSTPSSMTADLIKSTRAIQVSITDADQFFPELLAKVRALRDVAAPHPLSAAMAVASQKTFIEERRVIRLSDLVVSETERLHRALADTGFLDASEKVDAQSLKRRIHRLAAAAETLVPLVAHGCYWDDEHRDLYLRAIQRLADAPGSWNGIEIWLKLRRYPALLLFYASGIAAMRRNNFALLKALVFDVQVVDSSRSKSSPLKELLSYDVLNYEAVQLLFAPERRRTPFSDLLHDELREAFRGLVPEDDQYSDAFDRFEIFLALLFADENPTWPGAPIGRFAWRWRVGGGELAAVKREHDARGDAWEPYGVGLFERSKERFEKALAKVIDVASRSAF